VNAKAKAEYKKLAFGIQPAKVANQLSVAHIDALRDIFD
jgi:hypothetical protein